MNLTITTPQGSTSHSDVARFQFSSAAGLMEFLPGHAPMIAELRAGTMVINHDDYTCGNGVVRIENDEITVVCEQ